MRDVHRRFPSHAIEPAVEDLPVGFVILPHNVDLPIHRRGDAPLPGRPGHRLQVHQVHAGIGGGFDPDGAGRVAARAVRLGVTVGAGHVEVALEAVPHDVGHQRGDRVPEALFTRANHHGAGQRFHEPGFERLTPA